MTGWTCPRCGRWFGRVNQSHVCAPAMGVAEWFDDRPPWHRQAFDRVADHVETLGPVVVEAVEVGMLLKRSRTFAEVRPRRDGLVLSVLLSRRVSDHRISRIVATSANRTAHFVPLRSLEDVDDQVLEWVTEAYVDSPE